MSDQKKAVSLEVWGEQAWVPEPICTMDFLSHWAGNRMGRGREMGLSIPSPGNNGQVQWQLLQGKG